MFKDAVKVDFPPRVRSCHRTGSVKASFILSRQVSLVGHFFAVQQQEGSHQPNRQFLGRRNGTQFFLISGTIVVAAAGVGVAIIGIDIVVRGGVSAGGPTAQAAGASAR